MRVCLPSLLVLFLPGVMACGGPTAPPAPPPTPASSAAPPATADAAPEIDARAAVSSSDTGPLSSLPYTPALDVSAMDRTADACTSLYDYACGGWMKANPIPADQPAWSVYGKMADENRRFLWGILEDLRPTRAGRTPNQQKIGDYFAACMDEAAVEARGITPLRPELDAIAGLTTVSDLAPVLARLHLASGLSRDILFRFGSTEDPDDASIQIADVGAGGLGLPDRDYYTKTDARSDTLRQEYVDHVARMLSLLGDAPADAAREAQTVLAIETSLAKASLTRVERRDPHKVTHKTKVTALRAMTPSFDWPAYLAAVGAPRDLVSVGGPHDLASVGGPHGLVSVGGPHGLVSVGGPHGLGIVNVREPAFLKGLEKELTSVPLADWKTYLRWHLVHERASALPAAFVQASFDFYSHTLRGVPAQRPRWKRCVTAVDGALGQALGEEFVRRAFSADTRAGAAAMVTEIEQTMEDDITHLTWMGPETKKKALAKLHAVVNKVGYPEHSRDYGAVAVAPDDYLGDFERAAAFEAARQIAKIGKPTDRLEWLETPPTVNAYYNDGTNDMNFPAGVLEPPLFDTKLDLAPSYGNTGTTIGHELTHGFDDEGRQFDAKGNLRDWWTKKDAAAFESRAGCVVDQYAKYVIVDDVHINSRLTEGEDVADVAGTMLAYAAWKRATSGTKLESADGLTPDQRFFVGFAQWACSNERPENLRLLAVTDPHSPSRFRVDGVVGNMPEYQTAFACKAGQPMVRADRCRVW